MENDPTIQTLPSGLSDVLIDSALECQVIACLHAHDRLDNQPISAHVQDRSVYLEGSVPGEEYRDLARKCVENIFGIKSVYNNITFPFRLCRAC